MTPEDRSERGALDLTDAGSGFSQCVFCKHKHLGAGTCEAFPGGIPIEILTNDADHREYFPGDRGVRFEPTLPTFNFWVDGQR